MHTSMFAMQPLFGHNVYDTAYLIDVCVILHCQNSVDALY